MPLSQLASNEKTRREILHKSDLIPPLPDLVVRLLEMLNRQDTEPHDLEGLMQNDQVLVAKMLAMVNSPFYGLSRQISTIRDAVMVLGFRGLRSLVLASSTARFMQRDFGCYGHEPKGLWVHASCVAAGARSIAQVCRFGPDTAEQLFVGGLLHDIGKLLLVPYLNEARCDIRPSDSVVEVERAAIGLDHTEAGALVSAKWNLSEEIQEIVKRHHDVVDGSAKATPVAQAVAAVRLADAVAHEHNLGYLPNRTPISRVQPGDLAVLALDADAWQALKADLTTTMEEAVRALGNLGS